MLEMRQGLRCGAIPQHGHGRFARQQPHQAEDEDCDQHDRRHYLRQTAQNVQPHSDFRQPVRLSQAATEVAMKMLLPSGICTKPLTSFFIAIG
jgi:hypothetical protein